MVLLEAVHASQTCTRNQGLGQGRSFQWVRVCFPGIHRQARRQRPVKVVNGLTEDLNCSHRHIFFDNYFSSVDLDLHQNGLYGCDTLIELKRVSLPVEALTEGIQRGESTQLKVLVTVTHIFGLKHLQLR